MDIDAAAMLVVAHRHVLGLRIAEADPQMEVRVCRGEGFEPGLHDHLVAIAHAVEQPYFAPGLLRQGPFEHAQHRRDADAAADQHHRGIAAVDMEMPGRRANLQQAADLDMVVEVVRGSPARVRTVRRCRYPLDRYAITVGAWRVGKRVAADDLLGAARGGGDIEAECQELPGQETG